MIARRFGSQDALDRKTHGTVDAKRTDTHLNLIISDALPFTLFSLWNVAGQTTAKKRALPSENSVKQSAPIITEKQCEH